MAENNTNSLKYLTIGANDDAWGLVVTTVGEQHIAPNADYPAMQHPTTYNFKVQSGRMLDEFQLVYITEGGGYFASKSMPRQRVEAGTMIVLFPGEWHSYAPDKQLGWSEYWIGFKGEMVNSVVAAGYFSPKCPLVKIGLSNTLLSLYRDAIRIADRENTACQQLVSGIVIHMLGHILYKERNRGAEVGRAEEIINEARQIMRERANHNLQVEDVARELGVGYSWFRQNFKRFVGVSPAQHVARLLMSRAKELLVSESIPIANIAYILGFENVGQFSTAFRRVEGISPRQFRNENSKKMFII
uniref:AraC family transcriptional regulator n=1 Tax=Alistipes sp. TaxID=1872444 RepID=UPI004055C659